MMKTILGHADVLCKALQQKDQEVVSAVKMVSQTRKLVQTLRDDKWGSFLDEVTTFCKKHGIRIPDFSAPYFEGRSVRNQDNATNEHHYHYDVYNETIDFQLRELDSRFSEKIVKLLELSSALDPRDGYVSFSSHSILKLAKKYYYHDFTEQELDDLEFQLKHFELDMKDHPVLGKLSSIVNLCQGLAYTGKASHYS
ncbi:zinc finger MYM-type protein 1-like protein [Tanacetum coccineum]